MRKNNMCGSLLAPKPPSMPAPPAPIAEEEQVEPVFKAGNAEDDENFSPAEKTGRAQLKTFNTTDTGLAIPL
jgi:hypothetical protein